MTARRRLIPDSELRRALDTARDYGIQIGSIDIRSDGVTIYPVSSQSKPGNDFDRWISQDQNSDQTARRQ